MTWDVYALRAPLGVRRLEDMPEGYTPPPVGAADDIVALVQEAAPGVDTTDPTWLRLEASDTSLELALGKGARVHDLTFYINSGDGSVPVVLDVCRRLGITAYDTETGERLTASSTFPSFEPPPEEDEDDEPKRRWWQRKGSGS